MRPADELPLGNQRQASPTCPHPLIRSMPLCCSVEELHILGAVAIIQLQHLQSLQVAGRDCFLDFFHGSDRSQGRAPHAFAARLACRAATAPGSGALSGTDLDRPRVASCGCSSPLCQGMGARGFGHEVFCLLPGGGRGFGRNSFRVLVGPVSRPASPPIIGCRDAR